MLPVNGMEILFSNHVGLRELESQSHVNETYLIQWLYFEFILCVKLSYELLVSELHVSCLISRTSAEMMVQDLNLLPRNLFMLLFTKSYLTFSQDLEDSVLGMCLVFLSLQIFIVDLHCFGVGLKESFVYWVEVFVFLNARVGAKLLYCVKNKQHHNKLLCF